MEAGEGEEGRDCLLETQEESPSASSQASPACPLQPPPPTFPQVQLTKALPLSPGPGAGRPALGRLHSSLVAAFWPHGD